jgi:hypothetical protein
VKQKNKKLTRTFTTAAVAVVSLLFMACDTQEERLKKEARTEATKFWETRVLRKCGGEFGDYFGKRDGKVYQFDGQYVVAVEVKPGPGDPHGVFEWFGRTIIGCYRWRVYDNGAWAQWQEDKIVSPGLTPDEGRKALLWKMPQGQWTFAYSDNSPTAYTIIDCKDIDALQPGT